MPSDELNLGHRPNGQAQSEIDIPFRPDDKAEIGILIVHGIGEQKSGQTLVDYGHPPLRFMQHSDS